MSNLGQGTKALECFSCLWKWGSSVVDCDLWRGELGVLFMDFELLISETRKKKPGADVIKLRSGMRVPCLVFKMLVTLTSCEAPRVTLAELLFCKVWLSIHSVLRYLKCSKSLFRKSSTGHFETWGSAVHQRHYIFFLMMALDQRHSTFTKSIIQKAYS